MWCDGVLQVPLIHIRLQMTLSWRDHRKNYKWNLVLLLIFKVWRWAWKDKEEQRNKDAGKGGRVTCTYAVWKQSLRVISTSALWWQRQPECLTFLSAAGSLFWLSLGLCVQGTSLFFASLAPPRLQLLSLFHSPLRGIDLSVHCCCSWLILDQPSGFNCALHIIRAFIAHVWMSDVYFPSSWGDVFFPCIMYFIKLWNGKRCVNIFNRKCIISNSTCDGWLAALQEAGSWTTDQSPRCQTVRRLPVQQHCILQTNQPQWENPFDSVAVITMRPTN